MATQANRTQRECPAPASFENRTRSGLRTASTREQPDPVASDIAAPRPSTDTRETVRVPGSAATTRPVGPLRGRDAHAVEIPQAPRMPFSLQPRTARNDRVRPDILVEWVRANADDPRRE